MLDLPTTVGAVHVAGLRRIDLLDPDMLSCDSAEVWLLQRTHAAFADIIDASSDLDRMTVQNVSFFVRKGRIARISNTASGSFIMFELTIANVQVDGKGPEDFVRPTSSRHLSVVDPC